MPGDIAERKDIWKLHGETDEQFQSRWFYIRTMRFIVDVMLTYQEQRARVAEEHRDDAKRYYEEALGLVRDMDYPRALSVVQILYQIMKLSEIRLDQIRG